MHTLSRRVVVPHGPGRAAVVGFLTYVHPSLPHLLWRQGWEVADDIHDDFVDRLSVDNGRTWQPPVTAIRNYPIPGGLMVHTENAALYVPQRNRLLTFTNMSCQPLNKEGFQLGHGYQLRIVVSAPDHYLTTPPFLSTFDKPQGLCISFCHPLLDRRGRILVPVQWQSPDPDGALARMGIRVNPATGLTLDYGCSALLIGEFASDDVVHWTVSQPVPLAPGLSSRGLYEGAVAELPDGRLALILRGANHLWPERPGCKYLSFSRDAGLTWSSAQPLHCDDGSLIESSSTGSAFLRDRRNGQLYWIGNLCIDGRRPYSWGSNMPRSPIVIARVREDDCTIVRSSIAVIDRAAPHEHPDTQMSNFKVYQDRLTHEAVIYLPRYGERGYNGLDWLLADHYEYRVHLD